MNPSRPERPEMARPEVTDSAVPGATVVDVDVAEAARLAAAGLALLVDVREDDEWAAGHAPPAVHVPLGRLPQTPLPRDRPVLAICQSGNRSARAAALLLARGVDARNVAGGMQAWQAAGLAVATGDRPPGTAP